jgi:GAF domain-containing protein
MVVSALERARSLHDIIEAVRRSARALTHADGVTFVLRERGECFYAEEDAIAPLWKGRRFPLEACISGWVMLHGQIALIPDIYVDARIPHDAYRATFVKSLLMVPAPQERPLASIGAYWASVHTATWAEQHTLQSIANAAGGTLRKLHELKPEAQLSEPILLGS